MRLPIPLKTRLEARLLEIAAWILDRGVQRSPVVSRQDNNALFEMPYEIRRVAKQIREGYKLSIIPPPLKPCRSPYCECDPGKCTHPGFRDARHESVSTAPPACAYPFCEPPECCGRSPRRPEPFSEG